jgi:glycosyltransferase involved in cell wall biosynthesis
MIENELVSICIPVYNGEKYLTECLESAISQSYRFIEIVVVDDGSSDSSFDIISDYQQRDSRIKLFKNPRNLGLVGNWNECIRSAKGRWIKFIFQDDILATNCIELMMDAAINKSSDFVVCEREFLIHDDSSAVIQDFYRNRVKRLEMFFPGGGRIEPPQFFDIVLKFPFSNTVGEPCSFFFKKDLVVRFGGFSKDFDQICDFEFAARIGVNVGLYYMPERLINFRVHGGSTSEANHDRKLKKIQIVDSFILAVCYRYGSYYLPLRIHNGNAIRVIYNKKEKLILSEGIIRAYYLTKPYMLKYPAIGLTLLSASMTRLWNLNRN